MVTQDTEQVSQSPDQVRQAVYTKRDTCRICGSGPLVTRLDLGMHHLTDYRLPGEPDTPLAPLDLTTCDSCGFAQLRHTVQRDLMYKRYWYHSGTTATMRAALKDVAEAAQRIRPLGQGDVVLDIGSNDGTLLSLFPSRIRKVGFEPSSAAPNILGIQGTLVPDYFSAKSYDSLFAGRAAIIFSIAMFYDLDDPVAFCRDIAQCLAPDGVWVCQMNYLPAMLENCAFDNIGHEHLGYYRLRDFCWPLMHLELEIFHVEHNATNGGSLRIYVGFTRVHKVRESVSACLGSEIEGSLSKAIHALEPRITMNKHHTLALLRDIGKDRAMILGASTRGNTLLQTYGIDERLVMGAVDRDPNKVGRLIPGTHIPIFSEAETAKMDVSLKLVLPWFYREEIIERQRAYLNGGGALLFPLPTPKVVRL